MELVRTPPPALTSLQRRLLGITTVAVAATRIWARSATLWDWDEALFCMGVRSYDVAQHHPHPPGFPLYIATAKFLRLFVTSDFHALQAIVTVCAIALFPLLFWLARELRFAFTTAYAGALLFAFLPNVWFFGGTAFSDVPALALTIAACATLVRGCRDRRSYLPGALLLGLAVAIRPQALMFGCAPALVASWCRVREKRVRDIAAGAAIGIVVIAISYAGAALETESVRAYIDINRELRDYIAKTDSYRSPYRAPLVQLIPTYVVHEIPGGRISDIIAVLALVAIVIAAIRRDVRVLLLIAIFLPFNVFAWLMLDVNSVSRFAVGYEAMYALLAAAALEAIPIAQVVVVVAIAVRVAWWTVPPLREVRHTASPPVASIRWIRTHLPRTAKIYVHGSMAPFASYLLTDCDTASVEGPEDLPARAVTANDWFFREGSTGAVDAHNFVRERGRLFDMVRQRYFEVAVEPAAEMLRFGDGWYGEESVGASAWRWMSGHSKTLLPPLAGNARLTLGFDIPSELISRRPAITITLNGVRVDQFAVTTPSVKKSWIVPARAGGWNELDIALDKVINPAKEHISSDARDLGLDLTSYGWAPAP